MSSSRVYNLKKKYSTVQNIQPLGFDRRLDSVFYRVSAEFLKWNLKTCTNKMNTVCPGRTNQYNLKINNASQTILLN